jgi:hypothetical protein
MAALGKAVKRSCAERERERERVQVVNKFLQAPPGKLAYCCQCPIHSQSLCACGLHAAHPSLLARHLQFACTWLKLVRSVVAGAYLLWVCSCAPANQHIKSQPCHLNRQDIPRVQWFHSSACASCHRYPPVVCTCSQVVALVDTWAQVAALPQLQQNRAVVHGSVTACWCAPVCCVAPVFLLIWCLRLLSNSTSR